MDVIDVTLSAFKVRQCRLSMARFWSAGEEVCGDTGMVSGLRLATGAGERARTFSGLALEYVVGDWLDIALPDGNFGLGERAGEKSLFVASDDVFLELRLGLGETARGEVGVPNKETEDTVLIWNEDGGDEPKLIKARLAPKSGSRSGLGLGLGGVWVTGKPVLEYGSGRSAGFTEVKLEINPCMGAIGVEV